MTTARRLQWNFALQRAVGIANELRRPLVILEALRCDYPWASDRLHAFTIEGMAANASAAADSSALYYPYLEQRAGEGRGLLHTLSSDAAAIITDWYPGFFIPRMLEAAGKQTDTRLEAVDSNGLIPLDEHGRAFPTARGYRAFVQRSLRKHLHEFPAASPLEHLSPDPGIVELPVQVTNRWPAATPRMLRDSRRLVSSLPDRKSVV